MTHLTAISAATACGQPPVAHPTERKPSVPAAPACPAPNWAESLFYSRVANFLEMRGAAFHYSVIGGQAIVALAPGLADCHLLNDEIEALSRGDAAGARAQAGEE
jgi:hypothetical protein